MGGFGSCHQGHWEFSSPLDTLEKETNNTALKAAISAVVKVSQKTLIFGDSSYVPDGVAGRAYTWRRLQWCLPTGPVPNSDLWKALLLAIDMAQHFIMDGNDLLCHCCLTFVAFLLFRMVVRG